MDRRDKMSTRRRTERAFFFAEFSIEINGLTQSLYSTALWVKSVKQPDAPDAKGRGFFD
jgi:hypothetical protein